MSPSPSSPWWTDKDHPIWSIAKTLVLFVGVTGLLAVNAEHFDAGEAKTAAGTAVLALLMEAAGLRRRS